MHMLRGQWLALAVTFALVGPLRSQVDATPPSRGVLPDTSRLGRLQMLADVWARLSLLHPLAAQRETDWNRILVDAIPEVERATTATELARALNRRVFDALGDPLAVAQPATDTTGDWLRCAATSVAFRHLANGVALLDVTDPRTPCSRGFPGKLAQALRKTGDSELLLVDLRWPAGYPGGAFGREGWLSLFLDSVRTSGPQLSREHIGWTEEPATLNQWFGQRWRVEAASTLRPLTFPPATLSELYPPDSIASLGAYRGNLVILVNNGSVASYEPVLNAISAQPNIAVVYERTGTLADNGSKRYLDAVDVRFHLTALIGPDGALGYEPDVAVDHPVASGDLEATARRALAAKAVRQRQRRPAFLFTLANPSRWSETESPPTREERVAGVIGLWAVLDRFYPYKDYTDIDWDHALREWIPAAENAHDLAGYYRVLNEVVSKLHDAHARARHPLSNLGGNSIPAKVMVVEGRPVVVEVAPSVAPSLDLHVGDEIVAVDGRTVSEIEAAYLPILSAPHDPAAFMWVADYPLRGVANAPVELRVRRDGQLRIIRATRSVEAAESYDTTTVRKLKGGIGYINLRAIPSAAALDAALTEFEHSASGVILDLRGYPNLPAMGPITRRFPPRAGRAVMEPAGTPRGIARVAVDHGAESRTFVPRPPEPPPAGAVPFSRPVVVLIDGRAGSAAESYGLQLEAAPNVTMVGAPSIGTDGVPTLLSLPGGGTVRFTGERWVRDDGSRFHRIGIVPAVRAQPTIAGLRIGRDEVLERGMRVLSSKAPGTRK